MRSRRIACLLLGLWLGAGLWMQWVVSVNLRSADNLLTRPSPDAAAYLKSLGRTPFSPLAHYLAAEQNRSLYDTWGTVQIVMSAFFFFFLLFGTRLGKVPIALALVMVAVVVAERAIVIPEMTMVGRATDFTANPSHRVNLMWAAMNYAYASAELVKWLLAAGIAAYLIFPKNRRSLDSGHQVDMVDKANHRHIDR
jgi:hypothetical protein